MPALPSDHARVLRTLNDLLFVGRSEGPSRDRREGVPDYIVAAALDGSGIDVPACLDALAAQGLIKPLGPGDSGGTWQLPSGRVLRVALREEGDGAKRLYYADVSVQDAGDPWRPVVELAGRAPCGERYDLTPAGLRAAEGDAAGAPPRNLPDVPIGVAEQARALLAWAERELHDGVFLRGAVRELKVRLAKLLYALSQQPAAGGERAARLWRFFFAVDPRTQPVGHRAFIESFQAGEPTEQSLRDLSHADYVSVGPPETVDTASWRAAVERGFAGRAAAAELMQSVRELAAVGNSDEDLIPSAVTALLRRIPERWAEYDADALTATESQALFLLVAAGMVERRIRLRVRLHNHPVAVEATIAATGEDGFAEAMKAMLASMWGEWKDAYHAWRTGETRGAPFSITEHLKPDEWRLTDQGVLARADLDDKENASVPADFVLRRGFFDGRPRLILEPGRERISQREAVRGYGRLVTMRKVPADAPAPPAVSIGNWQEGAAAFAAAFEALAKAASETRGAADPATTKPATQRDRRLRWLAEAMLLVRDHPDWSDRRIAGEVGMSPSTLARSKEYQAAAALARGGKDRVARGFVRDDPDTGRSDIEAFADDEDSDR